MSLFRGSGRRLIAGAVAAVSLAVPAFPAAATACDEIANIQVPPAQQSERVRLHEVAGRRVIVILPPGYQSTTVRYPVVYLLHGGALNADTFVTWSKTVDLTAAQPADRQAIVVAPDGTPAPFWLDWRSGARKDATTFADVVIPWVDQHYRTLADAKYRAIAGISAGGFGALQLAGRRPDLFAAVGGFEALADISTRSQYIGHISAAQALAGLCYSGAPLDVFGMFGDPVTDEVFWRRVNPPDIAVNYGDLGVHLATGNGIPCDPEEAAEGAAYWFATQNAFVRPSNDALHEALTQAGVAHYYAPRPCGLHTPRRWDEQMAEWWGSLFESFGRSAPASFDYRSAERAFSMWGWSFVTSDDRAVEFLDVFDASSRGLGLRGSGRVEVTTAPLFEPGKLVRLTGAIDSSAVADTAGRISFAVSLGPAHSHQQFTPASRALEALGSYWVSKTVHFFPTAQTASLDRWTTEAGGSCVC